MPLAGFTFIEIVTAVNAYYMDYVEYGKYPLDSSKQGYDPVLGNPSGTCGTIFNVLRAIADSNWNTTKCPKSAKGFPGSGCKSPLEAKERVATQDTTSANGSTIKMAA